MQIANTEVDDGVWKDLYLCGLDVIFNLDEAEVFLSVRDPFLVAVQPLHLLEVVVNMSPDDCSVEGDRLRLWWD